MKLSIFNIPRPSSGNLFFLFLLTLVLISPVFGQKRDNLTNEEDLMVREAQEIDLRMQVFSKVINRRIFAVETPNAAETKESQKDINRDWGAIRTGTNAELFYDIQKTLEEAIAKLDDVAERNQKNPLFGKAVHTLADNCQKWIPKFKNFGQKAETDLERNALENSISSCEQIVEASAKVSREVPKEKKKKVQN